MERSPDVFLSYNSADREVTRELAEALRTRGLDTWLDVQDLRPGKPFQQSLEATIRATRSVAVLYGSSGLGPWEIPEMEASLELATREVKLVLSVLLPGAPQKPNMPLDTERAIVRTE